MKYMIWTLGAVFMVFAASCNLLNPTASQATVEASNQYGNSCPVIVNLDGNNAVTIANGTFYTFPLVGAGSHTLNFSTNGTSCGTCHFDNNGTPNYSTTFNANSGTVYVGTVKTDSTSNTCLMEESGP
jgi:hypothetical protein